MWLNSEWVPRRRVGDSFVGVCMNQSSSVVVSSEQVEASRLFGLTVHRCAVAAKGKTVLAKKAGLVVSSDDEEEVARSCEEGKELIKKITRGEGHLLDPSIIASVASAASMYVVKEEIPHLEILIVQMTRSRHTHEKMGRLPRGERN